MFSLLLYLCGKSLVKDKKELNAINLILFTRFLNRHTHVTLI